MFKYFDVAVYFINILPFKLHKCRIQIVYLIHFYTQHDVFETFVFPQIL